MVARSVLHDVQVPVRCVGSIGPGSKYRREPAARTSSKRTKYANLGLICRLGHKEVVAVCEIKACHVDGQARRMGAELARRGVIAVAALEPWSRPNRLQLGAEAAEDNRDDQIGGPLAESVCETTIENWGVRELDDLIAHTKSLHGYGFGHGAFAPASRRLGRLGVPASATQLRQALDTVGGLFSVQSLWFESFCSLSFWCDSGRLLG
jgi:hypothetical protein